MFGRAVQPLRLPAIFSGYRAAAMFRLSFSQPIQGPLSLGYANHFGMGRFLPAP